MVQSSRVNFDFVLLDKRYQTFIAGKTNSLTKLDDVATFIGMVIFGTFLGGISIRLSSG